MINGSEEPEQSDEEIESERVLSLVLEMDAALHAGRTAKLSAELLSGLTPEELRQLERARVQLQRLYEASFVRRMREPPADNPQFLMSSPTLPLGEDRLGISDELQKFLGIKDAYFGRFEILRELGVGGHGMVFLARDPVLDRLVALKVPKPDVLINPSLRKRFLAEGRAAGILTHPNIVTVFESNEVGSICYLAQDYIPGPTLAQWIEDHHGPVPPRVAALFFLQLADAVSFAHSNQILHRDIKPANILLAPPPNVETNLSLEKFSPKLADFGMAKMKQFAPDDSTRSGAIMGTPAYMSPEQAAGRIDLVHETSDIYSLGAILYELLTDVRASKGQSAVETLHQVIHGRLIPPRQLIRGFPHDLDAICMKCLSREPADRYPSAQALADDLRRFSEGRPVLVRPQPLLVMLGKWARRNPIVAALSGLIACSVLTMLIGSLWYNSRLQHSLEIVRQHENNLQSQTETLRRRVYADDLRQATDSWQDGNHIEARKRLEAWIPKPDELDLRTFAWWILFRQLENASEVIGSIPVGSVAAPLVIDLMQKVLYCGEPDGVIRARLMPGGQLLYELRGPSGVAINSLHLVRSGSRVRIASANADGSVRIWDLADRKVIHELVAAHRPPATAVCFLGSEFEAIASGGNDGLVRIWDGKSGQLLTELAGHDDEIRSLAEQPDTGTLFSSSVDESIRVWNWRTGRSDERVKGGRLPIPADASWARALAVSPDGSRLAAGFRGGRFYQWDITNEAAQFGELVDEYHFSSGVRALSWASISTLAVGTADSRMYVRRLKPVEHAEVKLLQGHTDWILSLVFTGIDAEIVTSSKDGTIRFWPPSETFGQFPNLSDEFEMPSGPSWNGNVLSICLNGEVLGYEMPERRLAFRLKIPDMREGAWSTTSLDGRKFFTSECSGDQYAFSSYDCQTGARIWQQSLGNEFVCEGTVTFDGRTLLLAVNREVWGLDVETGNKRFVAPHPSAVNELQCIPNSTHFITVCMDGRIRFWDVDSGTLTDDLPGHNNSAQRLAVSVDGKVFATSGEDLFIRVRRVDNGKELAAFSVDVELDAIFLVDDGRTLVGKGWSQLRYWSVPDQVETARWRFAESRTALCVSPDHSTLVSQNRNGVRLLRGTP